MVCVSIKEVKHVIGIVRLEIQYEYTALRLQYRIAIKFSMVLLIRLNRTLILYIVTRIGL